MASATTTQNTRFTPCTIRTPIRTCFITSAALPFPSNLPGTLGLRHDNSEQKAKEQEQAASRAPRTGTRKYFNRGTCATYTLQNAVCVCVGVVVYACCGLLFAAKACVAKGLCVLFILGKSVVFVICVSRRVHDCGRVGLQDGSGQKAAPQTLRYLSEKVPILASPRQRPGLAACRCGLSLTHPLYIALMPSVICVLCIQSSRTCV